MILYTLTGTPLVRPTFYGRNVAFQEGLPLVRDRNDYIFVKIYMSVKRGPSLHIHIH